MRRLALRFALTMAALPVLAGGAPSTTRIPDAWLSVPHAATMPAAEPKTTGAVRIQRNPIRPRLMNGDKPLTDPFIDIDSFDVSEARGEVVFSAKRRDNFDIGLVSTDGGKINWVPPEPVDEVGVEWAPRGNKASYVIRAKSGDIVRTVHIPTSAMTANDFPFGRVRTVTWDDAGERYSVIWSTPDASERVESMKYGGEARRIDISPAVRLDVDVQPFAAGAIILRPLDLRYDEKLPLVVWLDDDLYRWNDARGALLRNARVALVIAKNADDALWKAVHEVPWIDGGRVYLVGGSAPNATRSIVGDAKLPAGRYRRETRVVAVPPGVVQSFAAGFIADQLKGNRSTNGSRR
ncbi:MAG: hypothetical protein JO197_22015 [Acidobacteria bacterium]|nr:hypothetical protein [Acidobacteriota bacterium]MBV9474812.1 hypothetical protein [Acidobacteriota bacterium]